MRYRATQLQGLSPAHSPFRVVAQNGREVEWINRYLDQQRVRDVADSTLRSYAHDLLHFLRWWAAAHKTSDITQEALTESTFLDYIRFQVNQNPPPAAATVNRRVGTAERAMRREFPEVPPLFAPGFQNWYWRQSRLGYGRLRPALTQLRVKTPKRVIVPLSVDQVAHFWSSFRTSRDLAIVGLMLLHGLRSCEVLALNREDLQIAESQIRCFLIRQGSCVLSRTPKDGVIASGWGAATNATAAWAAKFGMNMQSSTLKFDETGEPFHIQQAAQIRAFQQPGRRLATPVLREFPSAAASSR
jgi:hypothetical protein